MNHNEQFPLQKLKKMRSQSAPQNRSLDHRPRILERQTQKVDDFLHLHRRCLSWFGYPSSLQE